MNKQQFLTYLRNFLCGLPKDDIERSVEYYSEIIDDRIEDGESEDAAVAAIGTPKDVANKIIMDTPLPKLVKQKIKPKRTLKAWEIVLLVLGSPLWISILVAVISVVAAIYISLWAVIISLYAAAASVAACVIACVTCVAIYTITGRVAEGVFTLGAAFLCAGLSILLFFAFNQITKGLLWLSKKIWLWIKSCFVKGDVK